MEEAMALAAAAAAEGEVPVGAVVVFEGAVVGRGRNARETDKNALAHAELIALNEACKTLDRWRLFGCDLYVTLEPCAMCSGAMINARIENLYFGAYDKRFGCGGSLCNLFDLPFNHKVQVSGGHLAEPCAALLSAFFKARR